MPKFNQKPCFILMCFLSTFSEVLVQSQGIVVIREYEKGFQFKTPRLNPKSCGCSRGRRPTTQLFHFLPYPHSHYHILILIHIMMMTINQTRPKSELLESSSGDLGSLVNLRRSLSRRVNISIYEDDDDDDDDVGHTMVVSRYQFQKGLKAMIHNICLFSSPQSLSQPFLYFVFLFVCQFFFFRCKQPSRSLSHSLFYTLYFHFSSSFLSSGPSDFHAVPLTAVQ